LLNQSKNTKDEFAKNLIFDISKDLKRTDLGNSAFEREYINGENPLYNVLIAYGMYDKEVGYCQGMNIVASWILKYTQDLEEFDDVPCEDQEGYIDTVV
jgi:hypothetical protein